MPKPHVGANTEDTSLKAWQRVKSSYEDAENKKRRWLRYSHLSLIFSFGAVLIVLIAFILLPSPPVPGPTQIIILTPTPFTAPTPTL